MDTFPDDRRAPKQPRLGSSLPARQAQPGDFLLTRYAFSMWCIILAFLPAKPSQLLLERFQEMLISAINWDLIYMPSV